MHRSWVSGGPRASSVSCASLVATWSARVQWHGLPRLRVVIESSVKCVFCDQILYNSECSSWSVFKRALDASCRVYLDAVT